MANFKAGVSNGGVSGNSRWYTPDNSWPQGKQFWASGWGQTEEKMTPGKMETGGTASASKGGGMMGKRNHKCPGCM